MKKLTFDRIVAVAFLVVFVGACGQKIPPNISPSSQAMMAAQPVVDGIGVLTKAVIASNPTFLNDHDTSVALKAIDVSTQAIREDPTNAMSIARSLVTNLPGALSAPAAAQVRPWLLSLTTTLNTLDAARR